MIGTFTIWPLDSGEASSALRRIGYNARRQVLDVDFKSGRAYRYYRVPHETASRLIGGQSKGVGFLVMIRGHFRARKLE